MNKELGLGWFIEEKALEGEKLVGEGKYFLKQARLNAQEAELLHYLLKLFKEDTANEARDNARQRLYELLKQACEEKHLLLEKKSAEKIVETAFSHAIGFGVLDKLLEEKELEEISVIGLNKPAYVYHRNLGWLKTNCFISSEDYALNLVNKMARELGRRVSYASPRLTATLKDGSRLHASSSPINLNSIELTIRKFREKPFSVTELIANNTISAEAAAFLWLALFADVSLLVAGNAGSGKTTTLNAIFSFIPFNERIVVIEETPEISIPHEHVIRMVSSPSVGVELMDLVKDSLRMRPDRVIVGEVRSSSEVSALIDAMLSGQARGGYATFHAGSARESLNRLQALGASAQDLLSINLILVQKRIAVLKEKKQLELRRVTELAEQSEQGLKTIFEYNPVKDRLEKKSESPLLKQLKQSYLGRNLRKELLERKKFLEKHAGTGFNELNKAIQDYLFG